MPQNATLRCNPEPLEAAQLSALELLACGETVTAAATAAGVARETVHRWLRNDLRFQASLNAARREMREATELQLLAIAQIAAGNLSKAVANGNVAVSVAVLKGLGFLGGAISQIGSDNVSILADEAQESERQHALNMRRLFATSG